jgi:hypothetical protein
MDAKMEASLQSAILGTLMAYLNDDFLSTLLSTSLFLGVAMGQSDFTDIPEAEEALSLSNNGVKNLLVMVAQANDVDINLEERALPLRELYEIVAERIRNAG